MREIARVQQGYFPTQDRIVHAIARLFKLPKTQQSPLVILDAGCGTGRAIRAEARSRSAVVAGAWIPLYTAFPILMKG